MHMFNLCAHRPLKFHCSNLASICWTLHMFNLCAHWEPAEVPLPDLLAGMPAKGRHAEKCTAWVLKASSEMTWGSTFKWVDVKNVACRAGAGTFTKRICSKLILGTVVKNNAFCSRWTSETAIILEKGNKSYQICFKWIHPERLFDLGSARRISAGHFENSTRKQITLFYNFGRHFITQGCPKGSRRRPWSRLEHPKGSKRAP